jgi:hypothetical protein
VRIDADPRRDGHALAVHEDVEVLVNVEPEPLAFQCGEVKGREPSSELRSVLRPGDGAFELTGQLCGNGG